VKIIENNREIFLSKNNYLSQGGEASIYTKDGFAYKIYHEKNKCISSGKIGELAKLNRKEILCPKFPIQNTKGENIGFSMPYIKNNEYLVKLFNKGYRNKNNVSPENIKALVDGFREVLEFVHKNETLVVDYNPFNFLVSRDYKTPYHIDVDSYQTKNYPATAIMDSIRDPLVKNKKFTEESDWFSWGIVMFELYMGSHPYKGRHPDYGIKDWLKRLEDGISVFNNKSKLPPASQDWDVIPKSHLKWFQKVFEHGERIKPPKSDDEEIKIGKVTPKIISSNGSFSLELIKDFDSIIASVKYDFGIQYVLTKNSFYKNGNKFNLSLNANSNIKRDFLFLNNEPYIVELDKAKSTIEVFNITKQDKCSIAAKNFFVYENNIYIEKADSLYEVKISKMKKLLASNKPVANLFWNYELFDGCVVEYWPFDDGNKIFNKVNIITPKNNTAKKTYLKELNGLKILEVKYLNNVAVFTIEKSGYYFRCVFCFNKDGTYTYRSEKVDLDDFDFTVLEKGVSVAKNGQNIEIFVDNSRIKVLDSPLNSEDLLFSDKNQTLVACANKLYKLNSK